VPRDECAEQCEHNYQGQSEEWAGTCPRLGPRLSLALSRGGAAGRGGRRRAAVPASRRPVDARRYAVSSPAGLAIPVTPGQLGSPLTADPPGSPAIALPRGRSQDSYLAPRPAPEPGRRISACCSVADSAWWGHSPLPMVEVSRAGQPEGIRQVRAVAAITWPGETVAAPRRRWGGRESRCTPTTPH